MKIFDWDEEKNENLKQERGISFEEVVFYMEAGKVLAVLRHTGKKYEEQKLAIVEINNYAYVVPFVETEQKVFLKTVFPSRKYTKRYLSGKDDNERV